MKPNVPLPQKEKNKTIISFAYDSDVDNIYAFYCSRYENISWEQFLNLGFFTFKKKLASIPKNEPLFDIIKSRTISLSEIKNKEERKYWRRMKVVNKIPNLYIPTSEIYANMKSETKGSEFLGGKKNGKKFNQV